MRLILCITAVLIQQSFACLSSAPRQYAAPSPGYYYGQQGQAPQISLPVAGRAAAAAAVNHGPASPINNGPVSESLFGRSVLLSEYNNNGYNSEGGGPVNYGSQLQCNLDKPCCWVNVPSPEDQIDWQVASGVPESQTFRGVDIQGNYLVAYAAGAAPSDEAQFASCSIACASSPIRVRARHWQSRDVLLQVCQRESFPNSVNFNPLLNCQEFPAVQGLGYTEVVLPKASLIDIVFVASNLVDESGSIAVLDDIVVDYESDPNECATVSQNRPASASSSSSSSSSSSTGANQDGGNAVIEGGETQASISRNGAGSGAGSGANSLSTSGNGAASGSEFGKNGFSGNANQGGASAAAAAKGAKTHGASTSAQTSESSNSASSSSSSSSSSFSSRATSSGINVHKTSGQKTTITVTPETQACNRTKCNFEDGTACEYSDAYQTQSIRGLTTRFQVVKGQFMNRVTGVHQGTEGNYYAATYLYPREVAGLQAEVGFLPEDRRLRFQYYEGTHGVQLKGCCDTAENCPFHSDKFVTVSDRMWKYGSFACPKGTERFIFLCENTRTNQGACGLDDIQVVENRENIKADDQPLC